jgi:branched-chain amino acid transport system ATP-binding protein
MNLLELRQVEVAYNKISTAITGVSIEVPEGKITALLGPNGAGKTTTLKAISGFLRGKNIVGMAPYEVSKLGISIVPERDKVFELMSVEDNLRAVSNSSSDVTDAYELFPRLKELKSRTAGYLSGGEKQILAISMALMSKPRLLLVDELSLGLAPIAVSNVLRELLEIKKMLDLTILLVDQNALSVLRIAEMGYVIEDGHIVFAGRAEELLNHGDIMEFYIGKADASTDSKTYRDVKQYRRKRSNCHNYYRY